MFGKLLFSMKAIETHYKGCRLSGYLSSGELIIIPCMRPKNPVTTASSLQTAKNINIRVCPKLSPNVGIQGDGGLCICLGRTNRMKVTRLPTAREWFRDRPASEPCIHQREREGGPGAHINIPCSLIHHIYVRDPFSKHARTAIYDRREG